MDKDLGAQATPGDRWLLLLDGFLKSFKIVSLHKEFKMNCIGSDCGTVLHIFM